MVGRSYSPDQLRKPLPESPSLSGTSPGRDLLNVLLMGDESTTCCVSNVRPSGEWPPIALKLPMRGLTNLTASREPDHRLSPTTGRS